MQRLGLLIMIASIAVSSQAMSRVPDRVSDAVAEKWAESVLAELSLEEKIKLCHGSGTMTVGMNPGAGIHTEFQMSDSSSTIRPDMERSGWAMNDATATAFPSMSALGATWDQNLAFQFGDALGKEARARGKDILLGPGINIHRTPLCGRNWEYPSEDPVLTAKLTVPYIQGVQQNDVAATVKHFALNSQELNRGNNDACPDERTLREIYLPAFEAAVKEGGTLAVMNAYNRFRGEHCSHHDTLNNQILKGEWGFKGLVVTDWNSLHDTVKGALGGTDIEMNQGQRIHHFKQPLIDAVKDGTVPESIIDDKARRILYVMAKIKFIGMHSDRETGALETPEHTALARTVAEQSITLLKNDGGLLPLQPEKIRKLLVVGNNAIASHCRGGGSAFANPKQEISPLAGIKNLLGDQVDIQFRNVQADQNRIQPIPENWLKTYDPDSTQLGLGQPAFKADYFSNPTLEGQPVSSRYETSIQFDRDWELPAGVEKEKFSVRWSARIWPENDGEYTFQATVDDGIRVYIDDREILANWQSGRPRDTAGSVALKKGQEYALRVEYMQVEGRALCRFGLRDRFVQDLSTLPADAQAADAVIYFTGNNHHGPQNVESEGRDRKNMALLENDNEAIELILAANPNTVIVNLSGSAVEMPWIEQAPAILQYYFSGQEGGHAIADVLFGKVNPCGKLPFTMPVKMADSPAHALDDYHAERIYYAEGVFVGYRWFDHKQIEPLFPFGHGLSYTHFNVGQPELSLAEMRKSDRLTVSVNVTNTGTTAGAEVVQLYVAPPQADVERPPRELKDFGKVFLKPGETKTVEMQLQWRDLAYWDMTSKGWKVVLGTYRVEIGTSSRDIQGSASFQYAP